MPETVKRVGPTPTARLIAASPNLLAAAEAALAHVEELEDAWMRGALSESDGKGAKAKGE